MFGVKEVIEINHAQEIYIGILASRRRKSLAESWILKIT